MSVFNQVLIIDDQLGDIYWLIDLLEIRGYSCVIASNEMTGRERLQEIAVGKANYSLAIIDVMMAVADIFEIDDLDEKFFEDSKDSGIRLCKFAREQLKIDEETLPIVCLTMREDSQVKAAMQALQIPLFSRLANDPRDSIRAFVERQLPKLSTPFEH